MLSESERALAIREGHRNAADAAYFNERPHLADDNGIRVFDAGFDRGWDAACAERDARIAEQDALIAKLRLEAQIHAQEASTANATIAEIYQSVTGGTGEPGNWHGAAPVKARIAELEQQLAEARKDAEAGWNARAKQLLSVPMPEDAPTTSGGFRAAIKEQT